MKEVKQAKSKKSAAKQTQEQKIKFRASKKWKQFKTEMFQNSNRKDAITGKPLRPGWHLHHLDPAHYEDLSEEKFACLNSQSHSLIHFLYRTMNYQSLEKTFTNIANMLMDMYYYEHPEEEKPGSLDVVFTGTICKKH